MRGALQRGRDRLRDARLADARLAAEEHDLPETLGRGLPSLEHERDVALAADEWRRPRRRHAVSARRARALADDAIDRLRRGDATQRVPAEIVAREAPLDQAMRRRADHHGAGLGERFEPRGDVRRFAERELLAAASPADFTDDHEAGVDADAHGERHAAGRTPRVQRIHGVDDGERRAHRARRVVLVRARVAEIDEEPVTEVLRDVAFVARDDLGAHALIGAHVVAQLLGIEAARERGRADEVAEHHGDLAPLGVARGLGSARRVRRK